MQTYDEGICYPVTKSNFYSTSRYQKSKLVLQSGTYYSTIYAEIISLDSADLDPQSNHKLQSSSLKFNPTLTYELVISRNDGFDKTDPEKMVIKISKLEKDAQLIE
jgi:hypothetical protein